MLNHIELTRALRALNKDLISEHEIDYVLHVLQIMESGGVATIRKAMKSIEITFDQFSVIAGMSEKVASLDSSTKNAISAMDFDALHAKMVKGLELFKLTCTYHGKEEPRIELFDLEVMLRAGRGPHETEKQGWRRRA